MKQSSIWFVSLICLLILGYCHTGLAQPPSAGMVLWLKADAGLIGYDPNLVTDPNNPTDGLTGPAAIGDFVGVWEDQSTNANDAWRKFGLPILVNRVFPNGEHPVVDFSGADGFVLEDAASLRLDRLSIYAVVQVDQGALSQTIMANYTDTAGYGVGMDDGTAGHVKWFSGGYPKILTTPQAVDPNSPVIMTAIYRPKVGQFSKLIYFNGLPVVKGPEGGLTYNPDSTATVGVLDWGRQFFTGQIAELLVYNAVDAQQQTDVQNYLSTKYGIALDPAAEIPMPDPDVIHLSANTVFACGATGEVIVNERWTTYAPHPAWSVFVRDGAIPGNSFLNKQDGIAPDRTIDVPLQKGNSYIFTFGVSHGNTDLGFTYYGLNIFFDKFAQDIEIGPDISVFAAKDTTGPADGNPPYNANGANQTMWYALAEWPGTGKLKYIDELRGLQVTLSNFVIYSRSAPLDGPISGGWDFIETGSTAGPFTTDGFDDVIGQYTLTLEDAVLVCSDVPADQMFAMDFNKDCYVDLEDFARFAQEWLRCIDPANPVCDEVQ